MEPTRALRPFEVVSEYQPSGDQPKAIVELADALNRGETDVVLLGATGTGKSATTAWLVEQVQRPTLILAHNKTLAAQLANEFRDLLPNNAVEYFVSYYDYYQPEAYVPQTDTFIEKDSSLNAEVERLRHSATNSLLSRRDVVVVSTVSCIYGLGTPEEYLEAMVALQVGMRVDRQALLRRFVSMQYQRNDVAFARGTFRVRGDTIEIIPMYEEHAIRIELFGDEIEALSTLHPLTGEVLETHDSISIFPGSHYVAGTDRMHAAMERIRTELEARLKVLEREGKLLEAQRLRMRTTFDLEMMEQIGFCSGIENYSRHIDGREAGEPPHCLLDYFPDDFLVVIDESHVTVPQIGAMYEGDASRKRTLVELVADALHRLVHAIAAGHVVAAREDRDRLVPLEHLAGERVQRRDRLDLVAEELDADRVLLVHRTDLRHGDVALVDHDEEVVGEVVEQAVGWFARGAAVDVPRVVLDAVAETDLLHHLEVVCRAHAQSLSLEQFALALEFTEPLIEFGANRADGALHRVG